MFVRPRVIYLGIFSIVLCNKYFYLYSHHCGHDYPALKKSNTIRLCHSAYSKCTMCEQMNTAVEPAGERKAQGAILTDLQQSQWAVFWRTHVSYKLPSPFLRCCLNQEMLFSGVLSHTFTINSSHHDQMTWCGVSITENGSNEPSDWRNAPLPLCILSTCSPDGTVQSLVYILCCARLFNLLENKTHKRRQSIFLKKET